MNARIEAGPPLFPMPKSGAGATAWPADGSRVTYHPAMSARDAFTRRHDSDLFVQGVTWPGMAAAPRVKKAGLLAGCADLGVDILSPSAPVYEHLLIDLDNPNHVDPKAAAWKSTAAATEAVEALHGRTGALVYATRAGMRVVWRLAQPINLLHAQSYLDQLFDDPTGLRAILGDVYGLLDRGCRDWCHLLRLPWVKRVDRRDGAEVLGDLPVWGDNLPPMEGLDAFCAGEAVLDWTAPRSPEEERRRPRRSPASPADRPIDPGKPPVRWYTRVRGGLARGHLDDIRNGRPILKADGTPATHNGLKPIVASLAAQVEYPSAAALFAVLLPSFESGGVDLEDAWRLVAHIADNEIAGREDEAAARGAAANAVDGLLDLDLTDTGKVKPTLANVRDILRHDYGDRLRLNLMTGVPEIEGRPYTDGALTDLTADIARAHVGCDVGRDTVYHALLAVSSARGYHPVQAYLSGLRGTWDGVKRVDRYVVDYLGGDPREELSELYAGYSRCHLIGLAARAMWPGKKMDTVLLLHGPQGRKKKSTALRVTVEGNNDRLGWFSDEEIPWDDEKRRGLILRGAWLFEMAELRQFRQRDATHQKSAISRPTDRYIPPYGKVEVVQPRACVFCATTNPEDGQFLRDAGRRWHVVEVTREADLDAIVRDRDQIWAEALHRLEAGEPWWLPDDLDDEREERNKVHAVEADAWVDLVSDWWVGVPPGPSRDKFYVGVLKSDAPLSLDQIALGALGHGIGRMNMADQRRLGAALRAAGWVRNQKTKRWSPPVEAAEAAEPA